MDCGEGRIHLFIMWILHQQVVVQPLHAVCAHKMDKSYYLQSQVGYLPQLGMG